QQMLATGTWRVRHVDHDNAPGGRFTYSPSVIRWWLAGLAWIDHAASGRPIGLSVERAAVWAGPALHLLLLLGGGAMVARWFGRAASVCFALGTVCIFPLAGSFLPGVPDDRSLALLCAVASVLPLLAALNPTPSSPGSGRGRFVIAGIAGGLGLWIDAPQQTWIIAGTALGAVFATLVDARAPSRQTEARGRAGANTVASPPRPWRAWGIAGAITSTVAYFVEYAPAHLGLRLEVNHPLYAVAWLGIGELLVLLEAYARQRAGFWHVRRAVVLVGALAATAVLPVALAHFRPQEWLSGDLFASRLTNLPEGVVAPDFGTWLRRDGLSPAVAATLAPLLLLLPALMLVFRRVADLRCRQQVALGLGPIAVALALSLQQLEWWATLDGLLLALLVVLARGRGWSQQNPFASLRGLEPAMVALAFTLGLVQLWPPRAGDRLAFTRLEVEGLIERAAAHWLADRTGPDGAVILVAPDRTARWSFHGGPRVRGLGSAAWANREGLAALLRITHAQTGEQAQALLNERGVTHLVLPSWNRELQELARLGLDDPSDAFITAVDTWALPSWLRPLPYPLPTVPGFEDESLVILQVTDETNRATALARMLDYFLETNRPVLADAAGDALRKFPADANALVAIAQLEKARGQTAAFTRTFGTLADGVTGGFDRGLAWDRRVALAIVLAQGERHDLAREQVQRCLERIDAERILTLSIGALYRLQVLAQAYGYSIDDPAVRQRAHQLLPEPVRERLTP
ncbi:MAG TPA: hypothetical protein VHN79_12515, partial [Lacunisphaera sp.]|nr:hypothetical protein [Lacunisphaera sp.]